MTTESMKGIAGMDAKTLNSFRWPSCQEPGGHYSICRYLADFTLKDKNGMVLDDMFVQRRKAHDGYIAEGTLLARPGSNISSICNVSVPFVAYSIDFSDFESPQRGYWMESEVKGERVFYKLVRPHSVYSAQASVMEVKIKKFLELYDCLSTLEHLNRLGFIECDVTVQELHSNSNAAFDLNFVKENGSLVLLNLVNSLQELKSALFIDSIRELGNMDRKTVLSYFPSVTLKSFSNALANSERKRALKADAAST